MINYRALKNQKLPDCLFLGTLWYGFLETVQSWDSNKIVTPITIRHLGFVTFYSAAKTSIKLLALILAIISGQHFREQVESWVSLSKIRFFLDPDFGSGSSRRSGFRIRIRIQVLCSWKANYCSVINIVFPHEGVCNLDSPWRHFVHYVYKIIACYQKPYQQKCNGVKWGNVGFQLWAKY